MSERDELRERLSWAIDQTVGKMLDRSLHSVVNDAVADAVLAEITKDHAIVPLAQADEAMKDCECGDAIDRVIYGGRSLVWLGNGATPPAGPASDS